MGISKILSNEKRTSYHSLLLPSAQPNAITSNIVCVFLRHVPDIVRERTQPQHTLKPFSVKFQPASDVVPDCVIQYPRVLRAVRNAQYRSCTGAATKSRLAQDTFK